jgi:CheY-like chemotaxis protein
VALMVLVADDSPTIQKRAQGILKGEGYEVETVSNGVAAIKRIAVVQPVVVLADVSMPGRDGYEVCDFVKKSPEFAHVPVLLIASDMEPYDEMRGAQVGADGKIKKPFEPQDLISAVGKYAAQFEAAAKPETAPTVVPPPAPTPEFALPSEEPDLDETLPMPQPMVPDFSAVSEGVAFAEPASEEAPPNTPEPWPAEGETPPPAPLEPTERWDAVPDVLAGFPAPEPAAAPPAETPAVLEQPQAETAEVFPAPEPVPAPAAETPAVLEQPQAESAEVFPAPEPVPAAAAETPAVLEQPQAESAEVFPAPEPFPAAAAETPAVPQYPPTETTEPVFVEEQTEPLPKPPSFRVEPTTLIFRAPAEIAEPVWKDETVPPPPEPPSTVAPEPSPAPEMSVAAAEAPVEQPAPPHLEPPAATASSLDSFSLDAAAAGQVRFTRHEPEAIPAQTPVIEPSAEAAPAGGPTAIPAPSPALDRAMIYTIVQKVVVRMSPPAIPAEALEGITRKLADEIASELGGESSQPQH